jgi:hypothetical protein
MINKTPDQIREEARRKNAELQRELKLAEVPEYILDAFEQNYETLSLEVGNRLPPDAKDNALKQVLLYWQKMRDVAMNVTHTEVKLSLPNQKTNNNTIFTIEGVVDIIRENDRLVMYDIKTHDADQVRSNQEPYRNQLNVYAHIWQTLRGQQLDQTAIIATAFPPLVKEAVATYDDSKISSALEKWLPLVEIEFDQANVDATISAFTRVVEAIEDRRFSPPSLSYLREKVQGTNSVFAVHTCRNCDARFSCDAYRTYAEGSTHGAGGAHVFRFYDENYANNLDQDSWLTNNIAVSLVDPNAPTPPDNVADLL